MPSTSTPPLCIKRRSFYRDKKFREWAVKYRDDEELFFKHFAAAWTKLTENGVKSFSK